MKPRYKQPTESLVQHVGENTLASRLFFPPPVSIEAAARHNLPAPQTIQPNLFLVAAIATAQNSGFASCRDCLQNGVSTIPSSGICSRRSAKYFCHEKTENRGSANQQIRSCHRRRGTAAIPPERRSSRTRRRTSGRSGRRCSPQGHTPLASRKRLAKTLRCMP